MIECLELLGYGAEDRGFKSRWSQPATWKFSVYSAVNGTFFESGAVMAAKGGGGLCFLHVVPKKQWASQPPLTLRLVGYRKSLSFMLFCMIWRR